MNAYTLSEAVRKLGLKFGRNTLYKILKERNVIDNSNRPFPKYIEDGYLSYHVKYIKGLRKDQPVTLVTEAGLDWLKDLLDKNVSNESNTVITPKTTENVLKMSVVETVEINGCTTIRIRTITYDPLKENEWPKWIFELPKAKDFDPNWQYF